MHFHLKEMNMWAEETWQGAMVLGKQAAITVVFSSGEEVGFECKRQVRSYDTKVARKPQNEGGCIVQSCSD